MAIRELSIGQVEVHAVPSGDMTFLEAVHGLLKQLDSGSGAGPRELETLLRRRYPGAAVHQQNPLSQLGPTTVWYAYRDCRFAPASEWSV